MKISLWHLRKKIRYEFCMLKVLFLKLWYSQEYMQYLRDGKFYERGRMIEWYGRYDPSNITGINDVSSKPLSR